MANTLGVYKPIFYANEALIHVRNYLGMAMRVHRGFEGERASYGKGDTISIRRPSTFTAASAPVSHANAASKVTTETVDISLDQWQEVKFTLTDQELAYTGQRIIDDHIAPAAYALANKIDQDLAALYVDVAKVYDLTDASPGSAVGDVTGPRKLLVDAGVPMDPGRIHYMINPLMEMNFLGLAAFGQWQGAGQTGVTTQLRGTLGTRFGTEIFTNQNVASHTSGVAADFTGALDAAYAAGVTTIGFDGVTAGGTFLAGDTFLITGDATQYIVTADATASTAGVVSCTIAPALAANALEDAVITFDFSAGRLANNLMFHRNAFALAMVPLPDQMGQQTGAAVKTVSDPVTGLSLRSRVYYDGETSAVYVALDCLYGVKTLDQRLAVRARGD